MRPQHVSLFFILLFSMTLKAAESRQGQPVTVEADRLEMDQKSGISIYLGRVVMRQGDLTLRADKVTLYTTLEQGERRLSRAEALGNPAKMEQQGGADVEHLRGNAAYMEYQPTNELLKLQGKAHLWRDADEFSGEIINYNIGQKQVKALGDKPGGSGRVRVLLQPEKKEQP